MPDRFRNIPGLGVGFWAAIIVGVAGAPGSAWAQDGDAGDGEGGGVRPSGAQRVVRVFDFEESQTNPLPIPYGWIRAQHDPAVPREREGFPIWNGGVLDYTSEAFAGTGSVMLPASGGSTSLRLLSGVIGVFPGADYGATVRVRTADMVHARAALAGRLLDQDGRVLGTTEVVSELVRTQGEWATLSIEVPGLDDRAAYLQLEMLVLQPRQQPGQDQHAAFRVWSEDYHAKAWFDDLTVSLLPRMEMDTGVAGHVIPAGVRPELSVMIRDLAGEDLEARVLVLDADGLLVDELAMRPGRGRLVERFVPELPAPGWYTAVLLVDADGRTVGLKRLDFALGAEGDEGRARSPMFALRARAGRAEESAALPTMAAWAGVGHAVVGVWDESMGRESAAPGRNPAFTAVRQMLDAGLSVTVSLDESPRDLADLIGKDPWDVASVLSSDEMLWMPWTEGMLDQFGQGVLSWQVGELAMHADGARVSAWMDAAGSVIAKWVPGPEIVAPWPVGFGVPGSMVRPGRGLVVRDDGAGSDGALGELVESWAGAGRHAGNGEDRSTLTIEFDSTHDGRVSRAALGRVARRMITAWAAAHRTGVADRVRFALNEPWRSSGGLRPAMMPTPELAAWRTLSSALGTAGTGGVGEIDLLPGVRTILAGTGDEGVLIAWLDDPEAPVRVLDLPLHVGAVRRVDLLGQRADIRPMRRDDMNLSWHRVELSREPVIIEGVRADLVRFLARVRLTPERLDPVLGHRDHALVVENPWPFPIRGRVYIVEPGGLSEGTGGRDRSWEITPRVVPFSIEPGATHEEKVTLLFGAGRESGWTPVVFDVQLAADQEYPLLRVPRRVAIVSEDLQLRVVAYRVGDSVAVHAMVTNTSQEPRSVDLATVAPGVARERASINGLNRGQTAERRFLLRGLTPGVRISIGLTETATGQRLTRTIDAP